MTRAKGKCLSRILLLINQITNANPKMINKILNMLTYDLKLLIILVAKTLLIPLTFTSSLTEAFFISCNPPK